MYMLQFNKGAGWIPSNHIGEVITKSLVEKALKKAVKKNPNADYRIIEFEVVTEVKSSMSQSDKERFEFQKIGQSVFKRLIS